jgi:hypothetical protein
MPELAPVIMATFPAKSELAVPIVFITGFTSGATTMVSPRAGSNNIEYSPSAAVYALVHETYVPSAIRHSAQRRPTRQGSHHHSGLQ